MKLSLYIALVFILSACSENQSTTYSDGPYVLKHSDTWEALWVCNGQNKRFEFPPPDTRKRVEKCNLSAELSNEIANRPQLTYDNVSRIAAISDIHGQYHLLEGLLRAHGVIDTEGNWRYGTGHLVITGDVFDRGPTVTESLWMLYQLDKQARDAGGFVHLLLGNHEVMVLNGDLRYLHEKYKQTERVLHQSIPNLFSKTTVLGQWLQSRNVLVKINNILFLHGGLHVSLAQQGKTLADINQAFTQRLVAKDKSSRTGFGQFVHNSEGPVWYRGYFREPRASTDDIDTLLTHFAVTHIVVGHTTQEHVMGFYDNKVIAIDSGIKRGLTGELLLVEPDGLYVGKLDGEKAMLSSTN
ncbi:MAG: metallophosphoesterase [Alteromonadaceae bacterium]|nr:metallophosphoesterase [Alteromonadaceae bacterium]